jgi:two-component system OmpR family response regulator
MPEPSDSHPSESHPSESEPSGSRPPGSHPSESHPARVLVVDDEEHITEMVAMGLGYAGFEVERAATGREALDAVVRDPPQIMILDVMLGDLDGFEVAKRLRRDEGAATRIPIIFLTARDTTRDKVTGLRLGSDDYVTKPFSIEELIERVKAVLRRTSGAGPGESKVSFADLVLDTETRDVWRDGRFIELTPTEFRLLHYLLTNARRVLTRSQILDAVWDYDFAGNASVLETYISYLRGKVDATDPPLIHTIRGVGYSLRLPR